MKRRHQTLVALGLACLVCSTVQAADATYSSDTLTTEAALTAAQAALASCQGSGYQVAVSVTDRSGTPIAVLRDRYAGPHTPETATRKAYTAASLRMSTPELARATRPGKATSGVPPRRPTLPLGGRAPTQPAGSRRAA